MAYFFNYITEAVRDKFNWIKKVRNAMIEVDKSGKDSKSSLPKQSTSKAKNNKTTHPTSSVKGKSNLNSSGKTTQNKFSSQKIKGVKHDRINTSPQ